MPRPAAGSILAASLAALAAGSLLWAQDGQDENAPASPEAAMKKAGVPVTDAGERPGQDVYPRRLPAGYGAVGLSREQKERVYAIQAKYDGRVQDLLDEIAAIQNKQDAEIATVLTDSQRAFLEAWRAKRDADRDAERAKEEAEKAADEGE